MGFYQVPEELSRFTLNGQTFLAGSALSTVTLAVETPLLLIKNISEAKSIHAFGGIFGTDSLTSKSVFRMYKNPTITSTGTQLPIINQRYSASSPASEMAAYMLPTISVNGTPVGLRLVPPATASSQFPIPQLLIIDPGVNLLVTVHHGALNVSSHAAFAWYEK